MVNERMKILQLVQDGKITPEQADLLLEAIGAKTEEPGKKSNNKWNLNDLKNLGTQISSAVTESLGEVKKVIEQQIDHLPIGFNGSMITASHDLELAPNVLSISAETTNGKIQVAPWEESYIRIHVRGQVKTNRMSEAREALEKAIQTATSGDRFDLTIVHGKNDGPAGAQVVGAHLDIYVPKHMKQLYLRTQNGGLYMDSIHAEELHGDTINGTVTVFSSNIERLQLNTENGRVDIRDSVTDASRQVYAFTKNGTITLEGLRESVKLSGSARTSFGRIDVSPSDFEVDADEKARPTFVRFRQKSLSEAADEVRVQLETKNGSIRIYR